MYPNARISEKEGYHLLMAYALRNCISRKAFKDMLSLINCFMPQSVLPSLYLLEKFFPKQSNITQNFYCYICEQNLKFENSMEEECVCGTVNNKKQLMKDGRYFLTMPIADRIHRLLNNRKIRNALRQRPDDHQSDVGSGAIYKQLKESGIIGENDITVQWSIDGGEVFHSSKGSNAMWPIQVAINKLPYAIRRNNLILAGLWIGDHAPRMEIYVRPFVDELKMLHDQGIECDFRPDTAELTIVKVHCLIGTLDSAARPKV